MTTTPAAPPRKRRPFFRVWLPCCVLALTLIGLVLVWTWPFADDWGLLVRPAFTFLIVQATVLFLTFWLLCFSGLRWYGRILAAVALLGADVASVREVKFTGNLLPSSVTYRWMPAAA